MYVAELQNFAIQYMNDSLKSINIGEK